MKNLNFFGLLLFVSLSTLSCSKINTEIDSFQEIEKQLIGNWIEKEPYNDDKGKYYGGDDGVLDTLIFTKNNKVGLYFPLVGWDYKVVTKETILFSDERTTKEKLLTFSINENGELTIYNFSDRSETLRVKDITFVRLEELKLKM